MVGETKNPLTNGKILGAGISYEVYSRQAPGVERGHPEFAMSRGQLFTFAHCPQRWRDGYERKDTDATEWGSIMDCLVTDFGRFDERYAVCPATYKDAKTGEDKPWTFAANVCKAWREEHEGKEIIKADQKEEADAALNRLMQDAKIAAFLECCEFQVMAVAEYHAENGLIIPVRCLVDLVPTVNSPYPKTLGDFKTATSGAFRAITTAIDGLAYDWQAALSLDIFQAAGEDRCDWRLLIQENYPPYQTARRWLDCEFLEKGRLAYSAALARYAECLKTNTWPSWDDTQVPGLLNLDGWTQVRPEAWMINK